MKPIHVFTVYSYFSGIRLWYFICPPTHQHFPVVPAGLYWVTVQPAQISSDASEIPESSNTLSWPPRNPPNAHTWDLTSAAVSRHLLAEVSSKRLRLQLQRLLHHYHHEHVWAHVWQSFCPLLLTFLVMNVQQQSAQGAFRVRGPLKDHVETSGGFYLPHLATLRSHTPPLSPQWSAGRLIMKLRKILQPFPRLPTWSPTSCSRAEGCVASPMWDRH